MKNNRVHVIFNYDVKQYFVGFDSKHQPVWASEIGFANVYDHQHEAEKDYEKLRSLGHDVAVQ